MGKRPVGKLGGPRRPRRTWGTWQVKAGAASCLIVRCHASHERAALFGGGEVTWTALLPCGASAVGMREGFMVAALVVCGLQCLETVELGLAGLLKRSRV